SSSPIDPARRRTLAPPPLPDPASRAPQPRRRPSPHVEEGHPSRYIKLTKDQDAPGEDICPGELNQPVHIPQGHNAGAGRQASTHGFVNWLGCVLGRRGWMRTTVTRVTSDVARQAASGEGGLLLEEAEE
uniref:Uncharacterized protein n=1 Tax=Aegilops tauschii subsp. strangulata TaxID=200361 RepID=A0A453BAM4_AEGTS